METISTGKYIELAYKIYSVDNNGNKALEYEFTSQAPDHFVYGAEPGVLEGFSRKLQGLAKGDNFAFVLAPEEAFGSRHEEMVIQIDRSSFNDEKGNFMSDVVKEGNTLTMQDYNSGQIMQGIVINIGDEKVTMDFNHRLAGKSVAYEGIVMLVREATADDLPQHHGCGGGCSCDSCGGGCGDHHDHEGCGGCCH
ncbi:MAG TPA: FKBP-type peptidyl-prolyl cis-trans isomerase [Candidatus Avimuribaculum pullicola]|nr:FKBP-type peptidyl-prolyl cis-trans isomerase [Candidatus Avimuribaculum pullicola]